jgi:hypothetical protein
MKRRILKRMKKLWNGEIKAKDKRGLNKDGLSLYYGG